MPFGVGLVVDGFVEVGDDDGADAVRRALLEQAPAVVSRYTSVWLLGVRVVKLDVWRDGIPPGPRAAIVRV